MSISATLAVRAAIRASCADVEPGELVLVACSGGADSLALAAGAAWVGQRAGWRVGAVVVDHGLQHGSAEIARWAGRMCERLGLDPVQVLAVSVDPAAAGGLEAAARDARYAALAGAADSLGGVAVLLGHTREDQAETVLMRLARGSGARTLAGMAPVAGRWRRPLLDLPRVEVHASADEVLGALDEQAWQDPHNADERFARVRARRMLERIEADLGPGAVVGLARSARLLRDDADALDALAGAAMRDLVTCSDDECSAEASELLTLARAVRTRVIRGMCRSLGSPGEDLTAEHIDVVDRLVTHWTGQGPTSLPGRLTAHRRYGRLSVSRAAARTESIDREASGGGGAA